VEVSVHMEETAVSAGKLDLRSVAPPVSLAVVHLEGHLEPVEEGGLFLVHAEVSEMQDETQEAAATSSPDPLTLSGPEDQNIDVSQQPLPHSAVDSSGVYLQNQQDAFQESQATVSPKTCLNLMMSTRPWEQKKQNSGFRSTGEEKRVQPDRMCVAGLPKRRPSLRRFSTFYSDSIFSYVVNALVSKYCMETWCLGAAPSSLYMDFDVGAAVR